MHFLLKAFMLGRHLSLVRELGLQSTVALGGLEANIMQQSRYINVSIYNGQVLSLLI